MKAKIRNMSTAEIERRLRRIEREQRYLGLRGLAYRDALAERKDVPDDDDAHV